VPLRSEENVGECYEILLRMVVAQNHLISPGAFLSTATRHHLMPALDRHVINKVLKWLEKNPHHLEKLKFITINLSGYSFSDPNFLEMVKNDIENTSIPTQKLCFEITETTALTNLTSVLDFMTALKKLGCRFALDNFGSGMASFISLKNLPVDFLKIDGTLIKGITDDRVKNATVNAINHIAKIMSIQTIAEQVENQATFEKLTEINVDYVQGYWIAEPQPL
jgi:EAL domain-containing protein (putative c-di-GMP-specific phosphodiesterase class I)